MSNRPSQPAALITLTVCCLLTVRSWSQERTWSDVSETYRIVAELIRYDQTTVTLKQPNGETLTIPLDKLSLNDNRYIDSLRNPVSPGPLNSSASVKVASRAKNSFAPKPTPAASKSVLPRILASNPMTFRLDQSHFNGLDAPPRPIVKISNRTAPANSIEPVITAQPATANPARDSFVAQPEKNPNSDRVQLRRQLEQLKNDWPDDADAQLIQQLVILLKSEDKFLRRSVLQLVGRHDAANNFEAIVARIDDPSFEIRWIAYEILGTLNDDRAIDPLIKRFNSEDRNMVATVLQTFGSKAEEKIAPFLADPSRDTRMAACSLLAKTGTAISIPWLQRLVTDDSDLMVRMQAKGALRQITERMEGK